MESATMKGRLLARVHVPEALLRRFGWTTAGYMSTQVIRFATNLVLTRLLAPDLFGVMILLISLRVGIELFTDIGIGQNLVANGNARDPRFYNTAWTLGLLRGLLLALAAAALVPFLSSLYGQEELDRVLPFMSLFFILTGLVSVGPPLAIKALQNERMAKLEVIASLSGAALMIGAAAVSPDIWGLMAGNLLATLASTVISYFVVPGLKHRFLLDRRYLGEIVGFGKWIFLSSVVYFLATNFDRLMLAKYVSFAMLGIYGVARSLGDVFGQFSAKIGNAIIFPSIASTELRREALQAKVAHRRIQFLAAALLAVAALIALSDLIVGVLYDPRYLPAAQVLPLVGLAAWVGILCTLNDNVLLGLGKPYYGAVGNAAKLLALIVMLPSGVVHYGILGAAAATVAAETLRYACLTVGQSREGVRFVRQDLAATTLMLATALSVRTLAYELGLAGSPATLFALTPL